MDPTTKSILTSIAMTASGAVAAWAAGHGLIPGADQSVVANDLVSAAFAGIALLIGWYKKRQHSPQAQLDAINIPDNGLKVVPESSPTPAVTAPLK